MTFRYFDTPTGNKSATVPGLSYCVLRIYVHLGLSDQQQLKFIFHSLEKNCLAFQSGQ